MRYVAEFKTIKYNLNGTRDSFVNRRQEAQWSPSSKGSYKMNVDVVINTNANAIGIGVVIGIFI